MTELESKTRAEAYCSSAEHCKLEVRMLLERHGAEHDEVERIIAHLVNEKYIDEVRYAAAFVHDKVRFAKWGRAKIAQALWQKQIPHDIIDSAISSIDEEEYLAVLKDLAQSKWRTAKGSTPYERKMRTMKSLCSRGFEPSIVSKMLDLTQDTDDTF